MDIEIIVQDPVEATKEYASGAFSLRPIMYSIVSDLSIMDRVGGLVVAGLLSADYLPENALKYKAVIQGDTNSYAGIIFYTALLDAQSLLDMFGPPHYHNYFGEGLSGVKGVLRHFRRYSFASYFVVINGRRVHIGYDHRGTTIEVHPDATTQEVENMLNTLVDKFFAVIPFSNTHT